MTTKVCKKCEIMKETIEFYKHKGVCKLCLNNQNKEKCKYCLKFFVSLDKHEKTKHSDEKEFKYLNNILFYNCTVCKKDFILKEFNHYKGKCKKCYYESRKKNKIKCDKCEKMINYYYFKDHKCKIHL